MEPEKVSGPQRRPDPAGETPVAPTGVNLGTDPSALVPLDPNTRVHLGEDGYEQFEGEINDFLDRYDTGMRQRLMSWKAINDAYNLVVDRSTVGPMPHAQQLVSEMTRVHVNITAARVKGSLISSDPIMLIKAWMDQDSDEDTRKAVEEAEALQLFWHRYFFGPAKAKTWFPMAIHRTAKSGASVVRARWENKVQISWYKGPGGKWRQKRPRQGRLAYDLIPNPQVKIWPLQELSIRDAAIVGHDSYESPASFRSLAKSLKLEPSVRDEILRRAGSGNVRDEAQKVAEEDLKGQDINVTDLLSFKGEVPITELWLQDYLLPGKQVAGNYQIFFYRPLRKCLAIFSNPFRCQQHPYFLFPNTREDGCVWPSGVGQELIYVQKTDSALWNMLLDNLKVVGNVLRIVESGTLAESNQDEISPGGTLVVDKLDSFDTKELGGDLSWIVNVIQMNASRGKLLTRVTNPEAGMADEVLKSGASPGSIAQLREGSGSHFKDIDENIRDVLVDLTQFSIELLQQYAPADLFYAYASEEKADALVRAKYTVPTGDLEQRFRISPRAPSATDNKEVMLQRLMLTFQMLGQHIPTALQLVDMTIAPTNPAGAQEFKEALVRFQNNDVLKALIENQEIAGLGADMPELGPPTPMQEQLNQAIQVVQQLEQQIQQLQTGGVGGAEAQPGGVPMGQVPNGQPMDQVLG